MSVGWWACVFIFDWVPLPLVYFLDTNLKAQTNVGKGEGKVHTVVGNVLFCLLHVCSFFYPPATFFVSPLDKTFCPPRPLLPQFFWKRNSQKLFKLFRYLKLIQCHSKSNNIHQGRENTLPLLRSFESSLISWENIFFLSWFIRDNTFAFFLHYYWRSNIVAMLKRLFKDTCLIAAAPAAIMILQQSEFFLSQIFEEVLCPHFSDREFVPIWLSLSLVSRLTFIPPCLELNSYIIPALLLFNETLSLLPFLSIIFCPLITSRNII